MINPVIRWPNVLVILIVIFAPHCASDDVSYRSIPPPPVSMETYLQIAPQLRPYFVGAQPFPHVIVDEFFPKELVDAVVDEFPKYPNGFNGTIAKDHVMAKVNAQFMKVEEFGGETPPATQFLMDHMRNTYFVAFLEEVTGISGLIPDPHSFGAGPHHTLRGGHLAVHLDYNFNPNLKMWRRINVFLYLNEGWQEEWKGNLEFWNEARDEVLLSIQPLFNRLVIFEASERSWHGHPDPLLCPPDVIRKSIAMYYYTVDDNPLWQREKRETLFMPRKNLDTWQEWQRYEVTQQ